MHAYFTAWHICSLATAQPLKAFGILFLIFFGFLRSPYILVPFSPDVCVNIDFKLVCRDQPESMLMHQSQSLTIVPDTASRFIVQSVILLFTLATDLIALACVHKLSLHAITPYLDGLLV